MSGVREMPDLRRRAIVLISPELLLEAMKFPETTKVLQCRVTERSDIELVCEHDALPEVPWGNVLPTVKPLIEHVREQFRFYWSQEDFKNGKEVLG